MNGLQVFTYEGNKVRTVELDGEPWWVARDVCEVLGYSGFNIRLIEKVPAEWKGMNRIHTPGGMQEMAVLSEQGLCFFLARSDKPTALPFQKWIAGKVLPSIRRYGLYADPALLAAPELLVKAGQALIAAREERQTLKRQIELDAPKVAFADAVSESCEVISFGQMAKILRENGIDIGRTRLCAELRGLGLLVSQRCVDYNTPTQKAANLKLFRLCARQHVFPDGRSVVKYATRVTGKGQQWILNYFRRKRGV